MTDGFEYAAPMGSLFEHGPADIPSWDELADRNEVARRRFARIAAKDAAKSAVHVVAAARDGILYDVISHAVAAVAGVGLFPLIETAAHHVVKVVLG